MSIRLQGNEWKNFTTAHRETLKIKGCYKSTNDNICLFMTFKGKPYKHWCSNYEKNIYNSNILVKTSTKIVKNHNNTFYKLNEPILVQTIFNF